MFEDKYAEGTEHTYVSIGAPTFKTRVVVNGKNVRLAFLNSTLRVAPDVAKALDEVLHAPGSSVAQFVRKIDRALGEEISRNYQSEHGQRAVQGPFSSNARAEMLKETLDARNVNASTPEALANFKQQLGDSMEVQEHVALPTTKPAGASPTNLAKSVPPATKAAAKPGFKLG